MLQINLLLEIMAHRSGCLCFVATFRSRSGCSNLQRIIYLYSPDCGLSYNALYLTSHCLFIAVTLFVIVPFGAFICSRNLYCTWCIFYDSREHVLNPFSLCCCWNRIIAPACPGPWSLGHQCLPWATRASPHLLSSPSPTPPSTLMSGDTCIPAVWPP